MNTKRDIILVSRNIEDLNKIDIVFGQLPKTNHLPFFYQSLDCRTIDIVNIKIGKKDFDLIIDDEGKLTQKLPMALLYHNKQCVDIIAGSFIIASCDNNGATIPITDDDFNYIDEHLEIVTQENGYQVLKFQY